MDVKGLMFGATIDEKIILKEKLKGTFLESYKARLLESDFEIFR